MIDPDIRLRVRRILRGERRQDDLDRIFLYLRTRHFGRESIQEIGDFVAHRDRRQKGPVTRTARDVFVSFRNWLRTTQGLPFTAEDIIRAANANLRIATADQLRSRLDLRPEVVKSVLTQAVRKLERGKKLTTREERVFNYLGGAFIWNPAFTDHSIFDDLGEVLRQNGYLEEADEASFETIRHFLSLYVLTIMHGSALLMENGDLAHLQAGFRNKEAKLEVKAHLVSQDFSKPVIVPLCLYWTSLEAQQHSNLCSSAKQNGRVLWILGRMGCFALRSSPVYGDVIIHPLRILSFASGCHRCFESGHQK
ncbi:hypothetical protein HFO63_00505 [Rhizobium laguerreae]|uniref:hypothetical protein n=1 Tax=Rhizobium laguerreae TaxID=1076926 RepID=UPI001C905E06|nr:hypothetical protein [Rhizobium laguerreae]MBY3144089.1 hypothetical protein [Rhizobium laguerreae]